MEFSEDDFLKEFGNVREEGNSTVIGRISLVFFRVFRYWRDVTELEDFWDMAGGDYGIEEISKEFACQRARVNDVLRVDSIWAIISRSLAQKRTFIPIKLSKNVIIFTCCY